MTRFALMVDGTATAVTEKLIAECFKREGADWWHWFVHAWLVIDPKDRELLWWRQTLQAALKTVKPMPQLLLLDAGTGRVTGILLYPQAAPWLRTTWNTGTPNPTGGFAVKGDPPFAPEKPEKT